MALSLLRDLNASSGRITIDGIGQSYNQHDYGSWLTQYPCIDIAKVPLHVLRSKLSYIPQESLLTSGSLRDALDITGEKDDHQLYAAMKQVHLNVGPASPFSRLDTLVSAGES
jgi:ABC-type multidrug transport system fused ATPase/permease subunit